MLDQARSRGDLATMTASCGAFLQTDRPGHARRNGEGSSDLPRDGSRNRIVRRQLLRKLGSQPRAGERSSQDRRPAGVGEFSGKLKGGGDGSRCVGSAGTLLAGDCRPSTRCLSNNLDRHLLRRLVELRDGHGAEHPVLAMEGGDAGGANLAEPVLHSMKNEERRTVRPEPWRWRVVSAGTGAVG